MRTVINIYEENYEGIKDLANKRNTTMTALVNQAIEGYLNGYKFGQNIEPELKAFITSIIKSQQKKK